MSKTDRDTAELSPEKKRERLAQLLKNKANGTNSFPLSFAQERLWFLDQLDPNNPTYSIPAAFRLNGQLNRSALKKSLSEIQRRHKVLQTKIETVDGKAAQVIVPEILTKFSVVDLQDLAEGKRETEMWRLIQEEIRCPFDLAKGPLWSAALFRLGQKENVFLLIMHHIVSDAWSVGVFMRELAAFYEAFLDGNSLTSPHKQVLAELPIQYPAFAVRQREWLKGEKLEKLLSYWKEQLAGAATLELPADHPRSAGQTFEGDNQSINLTKELTQSLKELSREEGCTLFMTLLAAFNVMLYRYTGQHDLSVGTSITNRDQEEVENLIGFFISNLVLRVGLGGNPSFREVLAQVRDVALAAYDHQDLPFEKIVDALQPERDLSRPPLFQVMFGFLNTPTQSLNLNLPGLTVETLNVKNGMAKFDLNVAMWEESEHLGVWFEYNASLFEAGTIRRMAGHFQTILEAVVGNPDQRLSQVPFLTEAERHQLVVQWNATEEDYPWKKCLHHLFEEQVERAPEAVAVVFEDQQLSYRALNQKANQLAHYLRKLEVKAETTVGICMQRSPEMVVGMLGILKAGGAYVPIDPSYPKDRLAFMIEDTRVPVLLMQQQIVDKLPDHQAKTVVIDSEWEKISEESEMNPKSEVTPENLAYVIYTSGSTGTPKGAVLNHRGRVNNFFDFNRRYTVGQDDKVLGLASLSFDMHAYDNFGLLSAGGTNVIVENSAILEPQRWAELMIQHGITVWHSVPALLEMYLNYISDRPELWPQSLRLVLLGGDWIPVSLPDRLKSVVKGVHVVSMGGATECSMDSTIYDIEEPSLDWKSIPYGVPMANQLSYVLDPNFNPLPIGIPGDLYLGGTGVGRGYHNRPQLTAEKFVPNPFSGVPGDRIYKTGDLACYMPDGNLELLGRSDFQVKVRGFRVETGEIESILGQHPAVRATAVVVRDDTHRDRCLVAYVVVEEKSAPKIEELRQFLIKKLPDYMIPAIFVFLDELPLNPNSKVDRNALPAPESVRPELEAAYSTPETEAEQTIAEIWQEVLRIDKIGTHDNFFALGGDSILSIQIVARVNNAGLRITPQQIFQHQTISELAAVAATLEMPQNEQELVTGPLQFTPSPPGEAGSYTPSDFALTELNQQELDSLIKKRLKKNS